MLIGGSGAHSALTHGSSQQVCHPAWPPHIHTLQEAHGCDALVIVRHLLPKSEHGAEAEQEVSRYQTVV